MTAHTPRGARVAKRALSPSPRELSACPFYALLTATCLFCAVLPLSEAAERAQLIAHETGVSASPPEPLNRQATGLETHPAHATFLSPTAESPAAEEAAPGRAGHPSDARLNAEGAETRLAAAEPQRSACRLLNASSPCCRGASCGGGTDASRPSMPEREESLEGAARSPQPAAASPPRALDSAGDAEARRGPAGAGTAFVAVPWSQAPAHSPPAGQESEGQVTFSREETGNRRTQQNSPPPQRPETAVAQPQSSQVRGLEKRDATSESASVMLSGEREAEDPSERAAALTETSATSAEAAGHREPYPSPESEAKAGSRSAETRFMPAPSHVFVAPRRGKASGRPAGGEEAREKTAEARAAHAPMKSARAGVESSAASAAAGPDAGTAQRGSPMPMWFLMLSVVCFLAATSIGLLLSFLVFRRYRQRQRRKLEAKLMLRKMIQANSVPTPELVTRFAREVRGKEARQKASSLPRTSASSEVCGARPSVTAASATQKSTRAASSGVRFVAKVVRLPFWLRRSCASRGAPGDRTQVPRRNASSPSVAPASAPAPRGNEAPAPSRASTPPLALSVGVRSGRWKHVGETLAFFPSSAARGALEEADEPRCEFVATPSPQETERRGATTWSVFGARHAHTVQASPQNLCSLRDDDCCDRQTSCGEVADEPLANGAEDASQGWSSDIPSHMVQTAIHRETEVIDEDAVVEFDATVALENDGEEGDEDTERRQDIAARM